MIRSSKEREKMSDEALAETLKPHEENVMKHIGNEIIYDFFPFVLASAFNNDCIWDDSTLEFEYIDAIDYLRSFNFPGYKKLDVDRIKFENNPADFQEVVDKIDAELFGLFPND